MADTSWQLTGNAGTNPPTDFVGTSTNQPLVVKTNGAQRVSIDTSGNFALTGNLGIGTSAPRSLLEVQASASGNMGPVVTLTNGAADAQGSEVAIDLNTFPPPATFTTIGTVGHPGTQVQYNPSARIVAQSAGNFEADVSVFCNRPGAADNGLMEKVRIAPGGVTAFGTLNVLPTPPLLNIGNAGVAYAAPSVSVGIGTASPRSVVEASVQAPGEIGPTLTLTNTGGGPNAAVAIDMNTYNPPAANYNPSARIEAQDDGTETFGTNILFSNNTPGAANNQLIERMRITSTGQVTVAGDLIVEGNVGVDTTDPTARLAVQGIGPDSGGPWGAAGVLGSMKNGNGLPSVNGSTAGVHGINDEGSGVLGEATTGFGVRGVTTAGGAAVWGEDETPTGVNASAAGLAGNFVGNVNITGTLTKPGGGFHIDHPLDPQNKYLNHSFVESPDMKNLYDGIAVLDGNGQATVTLPDWFDTLNEDFRYQLTPIGAAAPQLHVAEEIANRAFRIAGGAPRQRISWQVTGSRKDRWARAHRLSVEEPKAAVERGHYLHPELFGADRALSIMAARFPKLARGGG